MTLNVLFALHYSYKNNFFFQYKFSLTLVAFGLRFLLERICLPPKESTPHLQTRRYKLPAEAEDVKVGIARMKV